MTVLRSAHWPVRHLPYCHPSVAGWGSLWRYNLCPTKAASQWTTKSVDWGTTSSTEQHCARELQPPIGVWLVSIRREDPNSQFWRLPSRLTSCCYCCIRSAWYRTPAYSRPTNQPTNHMQHSPSWEANSSSASQEIPRTLHNPKVHYRIHNSSPPVPILMVHSDPVHAIIPILKHINFNVNHTSTPRSSEWSLCLRSRYQNPVQTSPVCHAATCPAHSIILDLINRMTFGEQHRSLRFLFSSS